MYFFSEQNTPEQLLLIAVLKTLMTMMSLLTLSSNELQKVMDFS